MEKGRASLYLSVAAVIIALIVAGVVEITPHSGASANVSNPRTFDNQTLYHNQTIWENHTVYDNSTHYSNTSMPIWHNSTQYVNTTIWKNNTVWHNTTIYVNTTESMPSVLIGNISLSIHYSGTCTANCSSLGNSHQVVCSNCDIVVPVSVVSWYVLNITDQSKLYHNYTLKNVAVSTPYILIDTQPGYPYNVSYGTNVSLVLSFGVPRSAGSYNLTVDLWVYNKISL